MKVSASVELVWQFAAQEAVAGEFAELLVEHFFCGLLKLAEVSLKELGKVAPGSDTTRELEDEVVTLRTEFGELGINTTTVRRGLRARMGRGGKHYDGGTLHRSQPARDVFDKALRLADESGWQALQARHLLQALIDSPTAEMLEVIGESGAKPKQSGDLPGRDLLELAANGQASTEFKGRGECKALLDALGPDGARVVLLVSNNESVVSSLVESAAVALAGQGETALKRKRMRDISSLDFDTCAAILGDLTGTFGKTEGLVLIIPPIGAEDARPAGSWARMVKKNLGNQGAQVICRIDSGAYDRLLKSDPEWRRLSSPMWLSDHRPESVPFEL